MNASLRPEFFGKASKGEPCPKKKAGILSGVAGSAFRASVHSDRVLGMDIDMAATNIYTYANITFRA
jgi:hypothetical protein